MMWRLFRDWTLYVSQKATLSSIKKKTSINNTDYYELELELEPKPKPVSEPEKKKAISTEILDSVK